MPYIEEDRRQSLRDRDELPESPGELNFVICDVVDDYLAEVANKQGELDYDALNEVVGVLESAKLEFFRRIVAPYEKKKRRQNGEVFVFIHP